jgi:phospholipid/cholesterol/gamma-HCH transport system ATP-binding protein
MLFRRELVMFGPREVLLTSEEPVVKQFLNGRMDGPIGMSEEKDSATMAAEKAMFEAGHHAGGVEEVAGIPPQMQPSPGVPERKGALRRQQRVLDLLHTLPEDAQKSIKKSLDDEKARQEKERQIEDQLGDQLDDANGEGDSHAEPASADSGRG